MEPDTPRKEIGEVVSMVLVYSALNSDSEAPLPTQWAEWFPYILEDTMLALSGFFCREALEGKGWPQVTQ